jgi:hypothetical protein
MAPIFGGTLMRMPARSRWLIALVLAIATLSVATVSGAARWGGADAPIARDVVGDDHGGLPRGDPSTAQPVEPTPGMAGVRARMFDQAIVNKDGTVTILFTSGVEPCSVLDHVDVDYGDDVTVTLFEGHDPNAGDVACIEIAVQRSVTITLGHPLDGRDIVDGAA